MFVPPHWADVRSYVTMRLNTSAFASLRSISSAWSQEQVIVFMSRIRFWTNSAASIRSWAKSRN